PPRVKSTLIASRTPLTIGALDGPPGVAHRFVHVNLPDHHIELLGVYGQGAGAGPRSERHAARAELRRCMREAAGALVAKRALVIGDFNSGAPNLDCVQGQFKPGNPFTKLLEQGWIEAIRIAQ